MKLEKVIFDQNEVDACEELEQDIALLGDIQDEDYFETLAHDWYVDRARGEL
jgi:hypothetical protein